MSYEVIDVTPDTPEWEEERRAKNCKADGCARTASVREMCDMHRQRFNKYGSFDLPGPVPVIDRLLTRLIENKVTGCWEWTGAVGAHGYGVIGLGTRHQGTKLVHRVTYEYFIANIPDGLHIDHLCRNKRCANPWHLDPVTQQVNNRRRDEAHA